jgi:hypothetical protein
VKRCRIGLLLGLIVISTVAHVSAQTEGKFAVGGEFTARMAGDREVRGHLKPGLLWRFGRGKPGWGFHWGLSWFSTDLDRSIGGNNTEFGRLDVRPFMAGYGYTYKVGRVSATADVLVGYAIGSIEMAPIATDAYQNRLGARGLSVESSNTFAAKPEIGVWYDINRKIGLNVNAGYIIARPDVTVHSSLGDERRGIRADQFILKLGVACSIF